MGPPPTDAVTVGVGRLNPEVELTVGVTVVIVLSLESCRFIRKRPEDWDTVVGGETVEVDVAVEVAIL